MSDLVERVARAIRVAALRAMHPDITDDEIEDALRTRDVDYTFEARAAIAAVAEWLDEHQFYAERLCAKSLRAALRAAAGGGE